MRPILIAPILFALALAMARPTTAQDSATFPDRKTEAGTQFVLNGFGLRTVALFNIAVYAAALYLEAPASDADTILQSPAMKLLELHFLRDLKADDVRHAWSEGLERNCQAPCQLDSAEVSQFLQAMPAVRNGDVADFLFTANGFSARLNGQMMGGAQDPAFARVLLSVFIGAHPAVPRLKEELLGHRR